MAPRHLLQIFVCGKLRFFSFRGGACNDQLHRRRATRGPDSAHGCSHQRRSRWRSLNVFLFHRDFFTVCFSPALCMGAGACARKALACPRNWVHPNVVRSLLTPHPPFHSPHPVPLLPRPTAFSSRPARPQARLLIVAASTCLLLSHCVHSYED